MLKIHVDKAPPIVGAEAALEAGIDGAGNVVIIATDSANGRAVRIALDIEKARGVGVGLISCAAIKEQIDRQQQASAVRAVNLIKG